MALINCGKCGHRVSTTAPKCPGCGTPPCQDVLPIQPGNGRMVAKSPQQSVDQSEKPTGVFRRTCPNLKCGNLVVRTEARFCGKCGTKLSEHSFAYSDSSATTEAKSRLSGEIFAKIAITGSRSTCAGYLRVSITRKRSERLIPASALNRELDVRIVDTGSRHGFVGMSKAITTIRRLTGTTTAPTSWIMRRSTTSGADL
jgi:hypothetical protein